MDPYVRALLDRTPIGAEAEHALALRAWRGDPVARGELIESGLRAVALRALLLGHRGHDLVEAVQAGTLGLIEAVDRFDPARRSRLATYAWWYVGHAMAVRRPPEDELPDDLPAVVAEVGLDEEALLAGLDPPDAEVLRRRFRIGLDADTPCTRQAVATALGISVSQVRTREARAMRQVRGRLARVAHRAPDAGADPL